MKTSINEIWNEAIEKAAQTVEIISLGDEFGDCFDNSKPGSAARIADEIRKHKKKGKVKSTKLWTCEWCGNTTSAYSPEKGWIQFGRSKSGGVASWCPKGACRYHAQHDENPPEVKRTKRASVHLETNKL